MYVIEEYPVAHSSRAQARPGDLAGISAPAVDHVQACITTDVAFGFGFYAS